MAPILAFLFTVAPIPPAPELNEKYMVGYWHWKYYGETASVVFSSDGTFAGFTEHDKDGKYQDIEGNWWFDRGLLVLHGPRIGFHAVYVKVISSQEFIVSQDLKGYSLRFHFTRYKPK